VKRTNTRKFGGRVVLIHLFYDFVFVTAILVSLPYISYRLITSRRFRAGLIQRLGFVPERKKGKQAVWAHGVSAGEIKTIVPILKRFERSHPEVEWAISTTTLAGYQMARKVFSGRFIFYFPLDIGFIIRNVIRRINPDLIILMELEIWPNLLYEADRRGTPVVIINGRISEKSFNGYRKLKKLLPEMDRITLFSVQNDEYRDRLLGLNVPVSRIAVTGNIKYDGIDTSEVQDALVIREEIKLPRSASVLVAGSTHGGEEEILLDLYLDLRTSYPGFRLVLVPRHIERVDEIEKACARRGLRPVRRTSIHNKTGVLSGAEILILDSIGE